MKRTILIGILAGLGILMLAVGVLYTLGTPQAPAASTTAQVTDANAPSATGTPLDAPPLDADTPGSSGTIAEGEVRTDVSQPVPEPDPNTPLAIQIPGCVCHSDDPKVVEEHAAYRMNQCAGCHLGETPTGK